MMQYYRKHTNIYLTLTLHLYAFQGVDFISNEDKLSACLKNENMDVFFVLDINESMSTPISSSPPSSSTDPIRSKLEVALEFILKTFHSLKKSDRGGLVTTSLASQ